MKFAALIFMIIATSCAFSQSKETPTASKYTSAEIVAQCKKDAQETTDAIETENKEKRALVQAAESRLLTPDETQKLLDYDLYVFVLDSPIYSCTANGSSINWVSTYSNEDDLRKQFLDLFYQQARFRSLQKEEDKPKIVPFPSR